LTEIAFKKFNKITSYLEILQLSHKNCMDISHTLFSRYINQDNVKKISVLRVLPFSAL
jgi:hypothetical protein